MSVGLRWFLIAFDLYHFLPIYSKYFLFYPMSNFKKSVATASLAIAAALAGSPAKAETDKQMSMTK
jgi:hypothetical protein